MSRSDALQTIRTDAFGVGWFPVVEGRPGMLLKRGGCRNRAGICTNRSHLVGIRDPERLDDEMALPQRIVEASWIVRVKLSPVIVLESGRETPESSSWRCPGFGSSGNHVQTKRSKPLSQDPVPSQRLGQETGAASLSHMKEAKTHSPNICFPLRFLQPSLGLQERVTRSKTEHKYYKWIPVYPLANTCSCRYSEPAQAHAVSISAFKPTTLYTFLLGSFSRGLDSIMHPRCL